VQPTIPICDRTPKACSFIHASLIIVRGGYCHRSLVDRWLVGHVRELWLNGDSYYWILNRKPYQGAIEWFQPPSVISNLGFRPHCWNLAHFTVLFHLLFHCACVTSAESRSPVLQLTCEILVVIMERVLSSRLSQRLLLVTRTACDANFAVISKRYSRCTLDMRTFGHLASVTC